MISFLSLLNYVLYFHYKHPSYEFCDCSRVFIFLGREVGFYCISFTEMVTMYPLLKKAYVLNY